MRAEAFTRWRAGIVGTNVGTSETEVEEVSRSADASNQRQILRERFLGIAASLVALCRPRTGRTVRLNNACVLTAKDKIGAKQHKTSLTLANFLLSA